MVEMNQRLPLGEDISTFVTRESTVSVATMSDHMHPESLELFRKFSYS